MIDLVFGTSDLTPAGELPLFGYQSRDAVAIGADVALEANFVGLPTREGWLILLSLDTLFAGPDLGPAIEDALRDRGRSDVCAVLPIASHTHYAPALDPTKPRLGVADGDYFDVVVERAVNEIDAVLGQETKTSAELWFHHAACDLNVSRRKRTVAIHIAQRRVSRSTMTRPNPETPVRHQLDVVLARVDGDVQAAIWSWPCHPVNAASDSRYSADFPGVVREQIRQAVGDPNLAVLYLPGFAGDLRANFPAYLSNLRQTVLTPFTRHFAKNSEQRFSTLTTAVSSAAVEAIASPGHPLLATAVELRRSSIPLAALMEGTDAATATLELAAVSTEGFRLVLLSAEVCEPYYKLLAANDDRLSIFSGYLGDCYGYLPTDSQITEGGYEVSGFRQPFSLDATYRPQVQETVVAALAAMDQTKQ